MINICCYCGQSSGTLLCSLCEEWCVSREEVFPTIGDVLVEQFHRIGREGRRYWGKMGAGILFTDGKSILLLKRKEPSDHAGTWGIPGGRAKDGEAPIDTARRESKEECGQKDGQQFARFHDKDGSHHFHVFLYSVAKPFECTVSNEHSQAKWIPITEMLNYPLHPRLKKSLPYYLNSVKQKFSRHKRFSEWLSEKLI
jgi:ADP-ribose pyrophosphatase YjhB (NUDIX family)